MYHDAIKAKYPTLTLISSIDASLFPNPKPSIISDIHLYQSVSDTLKLFHTYDNHPRNRPLLIGEYATIFDSTTRPGDEIEDPTLESATAEAVMFLGLERNSDVVLGSCHGGLIKNLLQPNTHVALMKHSASKIVFSMSYYIAKMFASNCGEETVPTTSDTGFGPLYWSATKNLTGTYFVKIVNFDGARMTPVIVDIPGSRKEVGRLVTYTAPNKESTNTLGNAEGVWAERSVERGSDGFKFTLFGKYVTAVLVVEAKAGNYGTARQ
jgi:alpha-N-arabinofuranosidase